MMANQIEAGTGNDAPVEVSFVMPCLDEAQTLPTCIAAAQSCIDEGNLVAEIVVADNGSRDESVRVAEAHGARVVTVADKGYGNALRAGFGAARGKYLIMGDADASYDFAAAMPFVERLRSGHDVVMGSRFKGEILPGAMPWSHRWIGNPILSWLGRRLFRTSISDFHCGMRGLTKEAFDRLGLRTTGMEFATELVAKAALGKMKISEIPITLHPDGRSRAPHLQSWRDGWRHLSFMLLMSPVLALIAPGILIAALGIIGMAAILLAPISGIGSQHMGPHALALGGLLTVLGYQSMTMGVAARLFGLDGELGPAAPLLERLSAYVSLERGMVTGVLMFLVGGVTVGGVAYVRIEGHLGFDEVGQTITYMIVGTTVCALGAQTVLMSLFYSMLDIGRESRRR